MNWEAFKAFIRNLNPRSLAIAFSVVLVILGFLCYFTFATWTDWYTAMGFYVSVVGFGYLIFELYRTREVAELAKEAAQEQLRAYQKAASEQSGEHYRYCLEQAKRWLDHISHHMQVKQWRSAE